MGGGGGAEADSLSGTQLSSLKGSMHFLVFNVGVSVPGIAGARSVPCTFPCQDPIT